MIGRDLVLATVFVSLGAALALTTETSRGSFCDTRTPEPIPLPTKKEK